MDLWFDIYIKLMLIINVLLLRAAHRQRYPGSTRCVITPSGSQILVTLRVHPELHTESSTPNSPRTARKPTIIYLHALHTARGRRSAQEPPTASGGPANHAQQESRHEARQGRTAPPTCLPSPDCTGGPEAIRSPATLDTIHRHGGRHHRPQEATTPTPDRWTSTAPTTRNANRGPHHTYITFYYTYIKKNIA